MIAHIVKNDDEGANDMLKCEVMRRLSLVSNEIAIWVYQLQD